MAFPTFVAAPTITSFDSGNPTAWTQDLPATTVSGELLLIGGAIDDGNNVAITYDNSTAGSWTTILEGDNAGAVKGFVRWKVSDGTEGGKQLSHTLDVGQEGAVWCIRIQDWEGTDGVAISTGAGGNDTAPNPDSVTAAGGAGDNLFIALAFMDNVDGITGYPYADNNYTGIHGGGDGATYAICSDELTSASADPGTFTLAGADQWIACTVVVEPAGGTDIPITIPTGPVR